VPHCRLGVLSQRMALQLADSVLRPGAGLVEQLREPHSPTSPGPWHDGQDTSQRLRDGIVSRSKKAAEADLKTTA